MACPLTTIRDSFRALSPPAVDRGSAGSNPNAADPYPITHIVPVITAIPMIRLIEADSRNEKINCIPCIPHL